MMHFSPRHWLHAALVGAAMLIAPADTRAMTIERVVSPAGIEAWLVRDPTLPIVAVEFTFRGGSALDPVGKEGRAQLATDLMDQAVGPHDSQALSTILEDRGISLSISAGLDSVDGSLKALTDHLDVAAELMRLALTQPRFDTGDVERARTRALTGLQRSAEDPNTIARQLWMETAFPGHPYARPGRGTAESVRALTVDDLRAFARERFARDNLVIGISGGLSPAEAGALVDRIFAGLPARATSDTTPEVKPIGGGKTIVVRKGVPQSVALFGHGGLKRDDPDFYAANILNYIFGGGGFNSRLMTEVREKRGLAYGISTSLSPYDHTGLFIGSTATENARIAQSLEVTRAEWRLMREEGPSAEELEDAKTFLNGSFALRLDATSRVARLLAAIQYDKLGIDFVERRAALINAVTLADVKRVARRLMDPDQLLVVVVGEPEGLAEAITAPAPGPGGAGRTAPPVTGRGG